MKYRELGKTGIKVSEISLGTWQVGGKWGSTFDMKNAEAILNRAIDKGVNFIDTADVYGDRLSEKAVGNIVKQRKEKIYVATKAGRRINPHIAEGYTPDVVEKFVDESLQNMGLDTIDLIQLHCPPTEVYGKPEIFERLDELKKKGKIQHYGSSVETMEEAHMALKYPGNETIQVIFNMFRLKPVEELFNKTEKNRTGFIIRVPLASGLLSGKYSIDTVFDKHDHRHFNRNGLFFDKGETFSGVDYKKGIEAVEELKTFFNVSDNLYQYAIRWILMFDEVSCVIPGASRIEQVDSNLASVDLPAFTNEQMKKVEDIYNKYFKADIHHLW